MSDILSHENIISKPPKPRLKANSTYHHSNDKYDSDNANERPYHSNRISQPSSKVDDNDNDKLPWHVILLQQILQIQTIILLTIIRIIP